MKILKYSKRYSHYDSDDLNRISHVGLFGNYKGSYKITRTIFERFWHNYCKLVYEQYYKITGGPKQQIILGLAEISQDYIPILVDIDIKMNKERGEGEKEDEINSLYKKEDVEKIIEIYQKTMKKIIKDIKNENLICILLEKPINITEKYIKNGFHLHFPNILLNKYEQQKYLLPIIKKELENLKNNEMLYFIKFKKENEEIIDDAYLNYNFPWLLYGSQKNEQSKPYLISKIYDNELKERELDDYLNIYNKKYFDLPKLLSILPNDDNKKYTKEIKEEIISIENNRAERAEREEEDEESIEASKKIEFYNNNIEYNIEQAKYLIEYLSLERASDHNKWMQIGWILFNITQGSDEGKKIWINFSKKCPDKFDINVCNYRWNQMKIKDYTLGSLRYLVKQDNPEAYQEYKKEETIKFLNENLNENINSTDNDLAKGFKIAYGDDFIFNKNWYYFKNHIWNVSLDGIELRQKISSEYVDNYLKLNEIYLKKFKETKSIDDEKIYKKKSELIINIIKKLKSTSTKKNMLKECEELFYDKNFNNKAENADPYLIAYKNGVYDFKNNIFREGNPCDYLIKQLNINYKKYKENDREMIEINNYLTKVFPNPRLRKYFLDFSTELFIGGNFRKLVLFWTGEGDNGKTITQMLLDKIFGQLSVKVPTTLVTNKKNDIGTPLPEVVRLKHGVRIMWLEEPNINEEINIGMLKHLSGNDTLSARDLYEKGQDMKEIKPMFKIIFICNKLPRIKQSDSATWRRIRVLPFESTFCNNIDKDDYIKKKFIMDKDFSKKIPYLSEAFNYLLIQNYKKNKNNLLIEPKEVTLATNIYKDENDIYKHFILEKIIQEDGTFLSFSELYYIFKNWLKMEKNEKYIPMKDDVKKYFINQWGELINSGWNNYRLRTDEDDENDLKNGDIIILDE